MKTFKGNFEGVPIHTAWDELNNPPQVSSIEFTENQILLPEHLKGKFADGNIRHGATYTLDAKKNIDRRLRYQVVLDNGTTLRLIVDRTNEKKLRHIHKLNWYSNHPIKYDIFKGVLTAIFTLIIGLLLWLADKSKEVQLHKQQEMRLDSLILKVDSLTKLTKHD